MTHLVYDHELSTNFIHHPVRKRMDHRMAEFTLSQLPGWTEFQAQVAFVQGLLETMSQAGLSALVVREYLSDLLGSLRRGPGP